MSDDLYQALDDGLARLQQAEQSLDELNDSLPAGQEELRSMLLLAQSLEALRPSGPRPDFVKNARIRIWNRIRSSARQSAKTRSSKPSPKPGWRRALAGGLLALVLVFSGLGVASASALPGDALYNLKRGFETVQLAFTFSEGQEAGLLVQFAQERVEEIEALSHLDRLDDLIWAIDDYTQTLDNLIRLTTIQVDEWDEDWGQAQEVISDSTEVLEAVRERVPDSAQEAIRHAIERSNHGQSVLEILQQGGNPSELAPGQQDRPNNNQNNRPNDPSINGNAYGRNKNKGNRPNNRGNHGRGNPNGVGHDNAPDNPQDDD